MSGCNVKRVLRERVVGVLLDGSHLALRQEPEQVDRPGLFILLILCIVTPTMFDFTLSAI